MRCASRLLTYTTDTATRSRLRNFAKVANAVPNAEPVDRRSAVVELLYGFCDDDDDARDENEPQPLPHAGFVNIGNTCFISATLQLLLEPLLCSLPLRAQDDVKPTLGSRAAHAALHAALGMRCSPEMLQALTCSLPRGFGWHLGNMKTVVSTQEDAHEFALRLLDGCSALDDLLCAHVTSFGAARTPRSSSMTSRA